MLLKSLYTPTPSPYTPANRMKFQKSPSSIFFLIKTQINLEFFLVLQVILFFSSLKFSSFFIFASAL